MSTITTGEIVLEPDAQGFADAVADPPFLSDLPPDKGRSLLDDVQSGDVTRPAVEITDIDVAGGPAGRVSVRIVRPPNAPSDLPVVLYVHGGGWVFGSTVTHDRLIRELAVGTPAAVVFPSYSLSPEAPYPTAIEEIYEVARWIAAQGSANGFDSSRIAIAGDSVGGNMATAVSLMAKARRGPTFAHQLLFYPVTNAAFDTPSYEQFAEGFHLRRDAMQWFWDQYTTDPAQRAEITASPLRATSDDLAGLPPATVITAEADVLRDEGEAYAASLRRAEVPVTAARFDGTIHDFVMLDALANTNATRGAMTIAISALQDTFRPATAS